MPPVTIAESSHYTATSTSAEVREFLTTLAEQSAFVRVTELGRTSENQPIPLVYLADPPVATCAEARAASKRTGKPIVFILANIHAGEVEGKEVTLRLLRDIALNTGGAGPRHALLDHLIIAAVPNYNADGNDKMSLESRPGQVGPDKGQGTRANAQGLDLNRDYIKLEAPESRALIRFLHECDPHLTIDCHTTNGSHHRYNLTYEAPLNPSGHWLPVNFIRNELLPEITRRVQADTGDDMTFYGNFNDDVTAWETYSALPRFGAQYQGLRGQMNILSEAYSYATYEVRCRVTHALLRHTLDYAATNASRLIEIATIAAKETTAAGANPQPDDCIGIRHRMAAFEQPVVIKGYTKRTEGVGGAVELNHEDLGEPKDYTLLHLGRFEPTLCVQRPAGYILLPTPGSEAFDRAVENLRLHGVEMQPFPPRGVTLAANRHVRTEQWTITRVTHAGREFQNHRTCEVEADAAFGEQLIPEGAVFISTAQPLGTLIVYLLEPLSEDGLVTWNVFDDVLAPGRAFPVLRVRAMNDLHQSPAQ